MLAATAIGLALMAVLVVILRPYPAEVAFLEEVYANQQLQVNELPGWFEIIPNQASETSAIIFYPGGLVSADAYLYMLSGIALETAQPVYVIKFPLSLAVTNISAANAVVQAYPLVTNWTIAGHSLGGSMACRYAKDNSQVIEKLILMASYCDQSIQDSSISVLTLYGSLNNGIDNQALADFAQNLPTDNKMVLIEGMNHAQFGNYGPQRGDNMATISNNEAINTVVKEVVGFLTDSSILFQR